MPIRKPRRITTNLDNVSEQAIADAQHRARFITADELFTGMLVKDDRGRNLKIVQAVKGQYVTCVRYTYIGNSIMGARNHTITCANKQKFERLDL